MIAANSASNYSRSCSSNSRVSCWVAGAGSAAITAVRAMSARMSLIPSQGQALILLASFPFSTLSRLPMLILRGLACSAIGIRSRSTPAV